MRAAVKDANAAVESLSAEDQAALNAARTDGRTVALLMNPSPDVILEIIKELHPEAQEAMEHLKDIP